MRNVAIRQALFFPLGAMLVLMLIGISVPGYSSVSQQMSELGLLGGYPAFCESIVAVIVGVSIIVFSLALAGHPSGHFSFTILTSILFGASMFCNGIFPMGSPLHGLYGIGFFTILTPTFFLAEIHDSERTTAIAVVSRWSALITLFYLWLTITQFDPKGFHGITQRLAVAPMIGWYSYASYTLLRSNREVTVSV